MKHRLPRLQFSLRTLVIGMVIVAALASWHGARYARFRGRVAAKAELASYEIDLRGKSIVDIDARKPLTLSERWDQYWFGEDALQQYESVYIHDKEFFAAYAQNPQISFRDLLSRFPEINNLDVGMYSFGNHVLAKPGNLPETQLLPRDLMLAILALPKLKELRLHRRAVIDAEVAAAMCDKSLL
jgi:hypothetical protein